jgi:phenylacetate-CoA ligase
MSDEGTPGSAAQNGRPTIWSRLGRSAYLARHMAGQGRLPFRSPGVIRRLQQRRLRRMVAHAYGTVPYYRETMDRLGLVPSDFRTVEDLPRLPIIEVEQYQRDPEQFLSSAYPPERCTRLLTGGSTGQPRAIYHSPGSIYQNAAHGERERSIFTKLIGRRFGYRETAVMSLNSSAATLQAFSRTRALLPRRLQIQRQYISMVDPTADNVRQINEFRPDVIYCFGSYLEILFTYLSETGETMHRPKVITYSNDSLHEPVRRLIEQEYGIPVFGMYQANEALKLGFECEAHTGLHLNVDLYPLRIVDESGCDVPSGRDGEVVISNLVNPATVLLNYHLGDYATTLPGPCPCGRTLPLLSFPPGRTDDRLTLSDGQTIPPQVIRNVFVCEQAVRLYQVVQHEPARFSVRIVVASDTDRDALTDRLRNGLARWFGDDVQMAYEFVDTIERTPGGKWRAVVSLCDRDGETGEN